ncbi:MAG: putative TauE-like permease [Flavipsychrobacter sp.]|jgi:uncharacterized membrane protein YfcA|nr:putative TauE-like permease [Flavipsychrobacter sp.]
MSTGVILGLLAIGLCAGFLSSMVGIGGGIVIVPALVFLFAFNQKLAQGTSLALLSMPVALVAAYNYYKEGFVDWKVALILACAFVVGGYLGSKLVLSLDMSIVKKIFAILMIVMAVKYLFFDK